MKTKYTLIHWLLATAAVVIVVAMSDARAEVVRYEIQERSEFADGQAFGDVGAYERIVGKVFFAIDPDKRQNQPIVDLQHAPRDADGRVEFSSDLYMLAPKDLSKGNGAIFYDVNNRGNKLALRFLNDAPGGNNPLMAGNGFLMRRGYTVVWSGWDGELLAGDARLRLFPPVAGSRDQPITGRVRYEIMTNDDGKTRLEVNGAGHGAYRPAHQGIDDATLTWRLRPGDRRVPIPRDQFKLLMTDLESGLPGELPFVVLELPAGFRQGYLYELIYVARDPLVHGVSFASVRDLISSLVYGTGQNNPLLVDGKSAIKRAYGFGVSQSGRFLREMLCDGFNEDEQGRRVFDGLMPHVAGGGLGSFNHRFAQPSAFVTQHQNHDGLCDRFPFAYEMQTDPFTNRSEGILAKAITANVAPKIIHTQSSTEYWTRAGSLAHTDPLGKQDAELPENVRVVALGGTQHGPATFPPTEGVGQTPANPADYRPLLRAWLVALDRWCRDGQPAPPSIRPTIRDQTLVAFHQPVTRFPAIPGIRYPDVIQQPSLLDLGQRWDTDRIIEQLPPKALHSYQVLVPQCGRDGNERGCLLPPEVAVPLATFTGWNLRSRVSGAENELVGLNGSYILFPTTKSARAATGDPRESLEERYGTLDEYLKQLEKYCTELVRKEYLLSEDVAEIVKQQQVRAEPLFKAIEDAK